MSDTSDSSPTTKSSSPHNNDKLAYTDPDADVELQSTDGRSFKVESYILKAHSKHYRALLATPPGGPLAIPAPGKIAKLFLDLMHMKYARSSEIWHAKDAILKLCDEVQCPSVAERVVFALHDRVDKDPWTVFGIASQRRNLPLAKAALRAMEGKGVGYGQITPKLAALVTLPYLVGLFQAVLATETEHKHADGHEEDNEEWQIVAEKFAPVYG